LHFVEKRERSGSGGAKTTTYVKEKWRVDQLPRGKEETILPDDMGRNTTYRASTTGRGGGKFWKGPPGQATNPGPLRGFWLLSQRDESQTKTDK